MQDSGLSNPFKPIEKDVFVVLAKVLTLFFIPITLYLFSFVQFERKVKLSGIIKVEKQDIIRSAVKDTTVDKVFVKIGDSVLSNQLILELKDLQNLKEKKEMLKNILTKLERDLEKPEITKSKFYYLKENTMKHSLLYQQAINDYNRLKVKAPYDGKITSINVVSFDKVEVGKKLFEISGKGKKIISLLVPENLYTFVKVGAKVYIKSKVYNYMSYKIFQGKVIDFDSHPSSISSNHTSFFKAKISIDDEPANEFSKLNTHVDVEIVRDKISLFKYLFTSKD